MINRKLAEDIKSLMPNPGNSTKPGEPVSMWREMDRLRGFPEETAVIIFRTTGCAWYKFSSCSMCGYFNDVASNITAEDLMRQADKFISGMGESRVVKVFTSGSFLDPLEVPMEARNYFLDALDGKIDKLLVESRTEYLTRNNLSALQGRDYGVRIAIGLESANDNVVRNSINKGSTFEKFRSASLAVKGSGYEVRTYLLFKPPFLSEWESIQDILNSISAVKGLTDDVSINPMNVQKNTLVEKLWKRGEYSPPMMTSLAYLLLESRKYGIPVVSYPTGGNKLRGVHNDSKDNELLKLIYKCSLNQNFEELEGYYNSLDLKEFWEYVRLEHMEFSHPDIKRLIKRISSSSFVI
ncbi:MAG: archaeosine biosynthesis radical SAM protein RaSEA [Thermoplasmataceae archaeon]